MDNYNYPTQRPAIETTRRSSDSSPSTHRPFSSSSRSSDSFRRLNGLHPDLEHRLSHESKPRLSKEQQDILERHFQKQPKPSTSTKKGFAEALGVPADKVNNWFQNRRAKVKQDARKQQSAYNMYYTNPMLIGQSSADPQYIDPTFYQTIPETTPRHSMMIPNGLPIPEDLTEHFNGIDSQLNQPTENAGITFGSSEPTFDASPDVFNQFFGFTDPADDFPQIIDHTALSAFSKQFNPSADLIDSVPASTLDVDMYNSSATGSLTTRSSNETSSQLCNVPGEDSSCNLGAIQSNTQQPALVSSMQYAHPENFSSSTTWPMNYNAEASYIPETTNSQFSMMMHEQMPQFPVRLAHQSHPTERVSNSEASQIHHIFQQNSLSSHLAPCDQSHHASPELIGPRTDHRSSDASMVPSLHELGRCESTSSKLAIQFSHVDVDYQMQRLTTPSGTLDQPTAAPSLAARRQRRPAVLSGPAFQSASYNAALPFSPVASKQSLTPDMNLRRIKSSIGVSNGRVQKSAVNSAQRSPLHFTFPLAAEPPAFSRQVSSSSMPPSTAEPAGGSGQLQPLTPMSPLQPPRPPYAMSSSSNSSRTYLNVPETQSEGIESQWSYFPNNAETPMASAWSGMPNTSNSLQSYASPPETPMSHHQLVQFHPHHATPPSPFAPLPIQSMPVWDQGLQHAPRHPEDFSHSTHMSPEHIFPPSTPGEDVVRMLYQGRPNYYSNPGAPAINNQHLGTVPLVHASSEFPSGHSRQQSQQPSSIHPMQPYIVPDVQHASPPTIKTVSQIPAKPQSELFIQQYSPREPADPSRLPPKNKTTHPKVFTFANQGPESFSSPPAF